MDESKKDQSATLTAEQLADIVQRWKNGEYLTVIAKSYPVSYKEIWQQTRLQRLAVRRLTHDQIENALERLHEGNSLATIANDLNVCVPTLRKRMKAGREASQSLFTHDYIQAVKARYENGEGLSKIAKSCRINTDRLRSLLIYEYWCQNEPVPVIAKRFGTSRKVVRDCILKYWKPEDGTRSSS